MLYIYLRFKKFSLQSMLKQANIPLYFKQFKLPELKKKVAQKQLRYAREHCCYISKNTCLRKNQSYSDAKKNLMTKSLANNSLTDEIFFVSDEQQCEPVEIQINTPGQLQEQLHAQETKDEIQIIDRAVEEYPSVVHDTVVHESSCIFMEVLQSILQQ